MKNSPLHAFMNILTFILRGVDIQTTISTTANDWKHFGECKTWS